MGMGILFLDERDFVEAAESIDTSDRYFFISFQPISSIRSLIKSVD